MHPQPRGGMQHRGVGIERRAFHGERLRQLRRGTGAFLALDADGHRALHQPHALGGVGAAERDLEQRPVLDRTHFLLGHQQRDGMVAIGEGG